MLPKARGGQVWITRSWPITDSIPSYHWRPAIGTGRPDDDLRGWHKQPQRDLLRRTSSCEHGPPTTTDWKVPLLYNIALCEDTAADVYGCAAGASSSGRAAHDRDRLAQARQSKRGAARLSSQWARSKTVRADRPHLTTNGDSAQCSARL